MAKMEYNRRQFIKYGTIFSACGLVGAHLLIGQPKNKSKIGKELIKKIELLTATDLHILVNFYNHVLGFKIVERSENHCTFQTGQSELTFKKVETESSPFYHFAFNIPENKIKKAELWHKTKTEFIKPPEHLRDESLQSHNIVHFRHWNAHSLFFYDPAGNVVEYIARHTLSNARNGDFSIEDILCISEMGLVVNNVYESTKIISDKTGLEKYYRGSENFMALGDENGLIIFFKENTKSAFRTGRPRLTYEARVSLNKEIVDSPLSIQNNSFLIKGL